MDGVRVAKYFAFIPVLYCVQKNNVIYVQITAAMIPLPQAPSNLLDLLIVAASGAHLLA